LDYVSDWGEGGWVMLHLVRRLSAYTMFMID